MRDMAISEMMSSTTGRSQSNVRMEQIMTHSTTIDHTTQEHVWSISPLQGDAWAVWNASYSAPEPDAYRELSRSLYNQDVRERITALFARSDAQNARLESLLAQSRH